MEQHQSDQEAVETLAELRARQALVDGRQHIAEVAEVMKTNGERFRREEESLIAAFTYHAPTPAQVVSLQRINEAAHALAHMILLEVPPCADRSAAIRLVREARMTANAGIVLDGAI